MAIFKLADRVKETTATTGSGGVYTTDGAPTNWQTFLAGCGSGNYTTYAMSDGTSWETGIATVTASTLTRTTLLSSSTGSAINWGAGSKDVWCDLPAARVGETLLAPPTAASSSSSVDFTGLDSTYVDYSVLFQDVKLATDNVDFWFRNSIAASFATANYFHVRLGVESATPDKFAGSSSSDAKMVLDSSLGNDTGERINGSLRIFNPSQTTYPKAVIWDITGVSAGGVYRRAWGFGRYTGANGAIDGLRFMASSGNIESGNFYLFGRRAA